MKRIVSHLVAGLALAIIVVSAGAAERGMRQRVSGIEVHYGIVPAGVVGAHPPAHEEATMHGGARGKDRYHLVVALYGSDGRRIDDAQVRASVGELGMSAQHRKLEPMHVGDTVSFGNYFALKGRGPYRIAVEVRLPGREQPVEALFDYRLR